MDQTNKFRKTNNKQEKMLSMAHSREKDKPGKVLTLFGWMV